jgi:hypothetical protein
VWPEAKDGRPIKEVPLDVNNHGMDADGRPIKEVPLDVNNHGMDATRYAVMYVDGPRAEVQPSRNPFYA